MVFLKKKFNRKKYKSCNLLVLSNKEILLRSSFIETIIYVNNIYKFIKNNKDNELKCILFLRTKHKTFFKILKKVLLGFFGGWYVKINLIGRGYTAYSSTKFLKLNLGYSHGIGFLIPKNLYIFCEKTKKNQLIIFSYDLFDLLNFSFFLKKLKKLDSYKGKGLKFDKEVFVLKTGKKSQY